MQTIKSGCLNCATNTTKPIGKEYRSGQGAIIFRIEKASLKGTLLIARKIVRKYECQIIAVILNTGTPGVSGMLLIGANTVMNVVDIS